MSKKLNVCLLNDSFPPLVDGVATCVVNYASIIQQKYGNVTVCTPSYPHADDGAYPYKVFRYPSMRLGGELKSYRCGIPFNAKIMTQLRDEKIDLMHAHCPIMSATLARTLREQIKRPIIMTYHTKFDIDIKKAFSMKSIQKKAIDLLIYNVKACDEVWVVSEGAGENLRSLGYEGSVHLMENGVDFEKGRASDSDIQKINQKHRLTDNEIVFLFVGRMMWYKGIRLILDGLKKAKEDGYAFKMIFVGEGVDRKDIMAYSDALNLQDRCIFAGAERDRNVLRAYFSRANLFLFPSDFDTNGIVVREAAACQTPSLLLQDSCAAEGILHDQNGIIIPNNTQDIYTQIVRTVKQPQAMHDIGVHAMDEIYISWDDAVKNAYERYQVVHDAYMSRTHVTRPPNKGDDFFKCMAYIFKEKSKKKHFKKQTTRKKKKFYMKNKED